MRVKNKIADHNVMNKKKIFYFLIVVLLVLLFLIGSYSKVLFTVEPDAPATYLIFSLEAHKEAIIKFIFVIVLAAILYVLFSKND